jgi:hypothetical protein
VKVRRLYGIKVLTEMGREWAPLKTPMIQLDLTSIKSKRKDWTAARCARLRRRMGFNIAEFREAVRVHALMYYRPPRDGIRVPRAKATRVRYASPAQRLAFLEYWMKRALRRRWYRWEKMTFKL